jgi:hypothetical protein
MHTSGSVGTPGGQLPGVTRQWRRQSPLRLLRLFPELPEKQAIRAVLTDHLTAKNLQAEAGSIRTWRSGRLGFPSRGSRSPSRCERPLCRRALVGFIRRLSAFDARGGPEALREIERG